MEEITDQARGRAVAAPEREIPTDLVIHGTGNDPAPEPRRPLVPAALAGAAVVLLVAGLTVFGPNRVEVQNSG